MKTGCIYHFRHLASTKIFNTKLVDEKLYLLPGIQTFYSIWPDKITSPQKETYKCVTNYVMIQTTNIETKPTQNTYNLYKHQKTQSQVTNQKRKKKPTKKEKKRNHTRNVLRIILVKLNFCNLIMGQRLLLNLLPQIMH